MADDKEDKPTNDEYEYAIQRLTEGVERDGFGTIGFKDGRILMFKRAAIQKILDDNPGQPQIILFLQEAQKN